MKGRRTSLQRLADDWKGWNMGALAVFLLACIGLDELRPWMWGAALSVLGVNLAISLIVILADGTKLAARWLHREIRKRS